MIRIKQVKIPFENDNEKYILKKISKLLKCNINDINDININKKSLDCRHKPNLFYVYEFDVKILNEQKYLNKDINITPIEEYKMPSKIDTKETIAIIGSGPAGLFAAYILAISGCNPIIFERGNKVEERLEDIKLFWKENILNLNSNIQFGEGGAGTFSDGKLNTRTSDKEFIIKKIFEIFIECGAKKEIMYSSEPHIGTDILQKVVINLRKKIISFGAKFFYNSTLTDININSNKLESIVINNTEIIKVDKLILAIGNSARDTYEMLYRSKFNLEAKPFALGIRIQHKQTDINKNQYGREDKNLPAANYKLTYKASNERGVYTFCMCPGGYVVNASSENKRLAINGMSYSKRDSENANSAVVVTINKTDFDSDNPLAGIEYQRKLEEKAYTEGKGLIPIQKYIDYKNNKITTKLGSIKPLFKGNYNLSNINNILPNYVNESIIEGIEAFSKKIKCFNDDDSIIAAVESRTSSPVRIIRNENYETNIKNIYSCGEGAGYAGGITTSAMDGIKVASKIVEIIKNNQ